METNVIHIGDALEGLKKLPSECVDCCVTSPPYWGLRDYGVDGQMGLEKTPEQFIEKMVELFEEVRRVLKKEGTLWLNIGDSYARSGGKQGGGNRELMHMEGKQKRMEKLPAGSKLKQKDLVGIPWMLAFALRDAGWYLRLDVIWNKKNPMPESVSDRPTKAHEYLFLLSKEGRYFYDHHAIAEPTTTRDEHQRDRETTRLNNTPGRKKMGGLSENNYATRNKRSVWDVSTKGYKEAHFATFPEKLIEPCILAGCPEEVCPKCRKAREKILEKKLVPTKKAAKTNVVDDRDEAADAQDQGSNRQKDGHLPGHVNQFKVKGYTDCGCGKGFVPGIVLDPFMGAATTAIVARKKDRNYVGFELNPEYVKIANKRLRKELGAFL